MKFDKFMRDESHKKIKASITVDPVLHEKVVKLLDKKGKKFSTFIDWCMKEFVESQEKGKK